jgi:SET domain-containing protein
MPLYDATDSPPFEVRASPMQGLGAFATHRIPAGTRLVEYAGQRLSPAQAEARYPDTPGERHHTFLFAIDDAVVIDAAVDGNEARWINHSCKPSCETKEGIYDGEPQVFIYAKRELKVGEELFYDYSLDIEGRISKQMKKDYECRCGAKKCRGTMLALKAK